MTMSKTERAFSFIKKKILSGELAPSMDISEEALQSELNVSRTPIREALHMLQKEGFVDIYPRKGIVVTPISLDLLSEIYDVRATVEPQVVRRACGKLPEAWLLRMRERFQSPPEGLSLKTQAEYYNDLDSVFHMEIIRYARNRFFTDIMTLVAEHEKRIRCITFSPVTNVHCISEHLEMIRMFLERDVEHLAPAAAAHIEQARKNAFSHILDL